MKKNYILTFLGIIFLLLTFIFVGYFALHLSGRFIRIIVVAVLVACGLSYLLSGLICNKRLVTLLKSGKYDECIRLARKMMKWFYSGKNDSSLHLTIAVAYFSMINDEEFWRESEQVIAPRKAVEKYYWRTIYGVVKNDIPCVSEQYKAFLAVQNGKYVDFQNQLSILIEILNTNEEAKKKDLIVKARQTFQNPRIRDYLEQAEKSEPEESIL